MKGAEFLAEAMARGEVLGVGGNTRLVDAADKLGESYVEQLHGRRRGQRLLRRDYGFLEVTFDDEPDWVCSWIILEVHRLAADRSLIEELHDRHRVEFSKYTQWEDVGFALSGLTDRRVTERVESQSGLRSLTLEGGRTAAWVVADASRGRGDLPGDGDVWSISIYR